jgi:signal transduction histidine kinase/ActR/RegA family two-component response regulator
MKTWPILTVALDRERDIVVVRQRARRIAELLGFDVQDQTRIATAASEIARNAHAYGQGGKTEIGLVGRRTPEALTLRITDRGTGADTLKAVLEGRFERTGGLGLGVVGARRLMDSFDVAEAHGGGACVVMTKDLPKSQSPIMPDQLLAIGKLLTQEAVGDPMAELIAQNQELMQSLEALEARRLETVHLTDELERTNKGVVALYAELDRRATELQELNETLEARVAEGVAAREQIEANLRQSQKMEAVGQLTGGIAHDFNNLLMVIGGSLEMLRRRVPSEPAITRLLDAASQGVAKGGMLNQQLLAFARRQDLRIEVITVEDFIPACQALIERALSEDIAIEIGGDGLNLACRTDPHQLEAAVLNLAINARDAMPGGGTLELATWRRQVASCDGLEGAPGDYLVVSVRDTGVGMPKEIIDRAFEPFFTTKDVGRGTGLGLSQVYGFAKQSGGFVTIESVEGAGTAVLIHLPLCEPEARAGDAGAPLSTRIEGAATILVVEDDPNVRAVTSAMLRDLGYTAVEATTARAALAVLDREPIDLVFTDVILPDGMSGVELAHEVAKARTATPVLLTSGYTAQRLNLAGDKDLQILNKPYDEARLSEAISKTLSSRKGVCAGGV